MSIIPIIVANTVAMQSRNRKEDMKKLKEHKNNFDYRIKEVSKFSRMEQLEQENILLKDLLSRYEEILQIENKIVYDEINQRNTITKIIPEKKISYIEIEIKGQ